MHDARHVTATRARAVASRAQVGDAVAGLHLHDVAVQVEIGSKTLNQCVIFEFQGISSGRFQHGFDKVNLHCPTMISHSSELTSRLRTLRWMRPLGSMRSTTRVMTPGGQGPASRRPSQGYYSWV